MGGVMKQITSVVERGGVGGAREEGEATEPDQSPTPVHGDASEAAQRRADAVGLLAERALAAGFRDSAPVSGSRAERYQVMCTSTRPH
jgi:hypothetical protein